MSIQLIISFFVITSGLIYFNLAHYQVEQVFKHALIDKDQMATISMPDVDTTHWFFERYKALEESMQHNSSIEGVGSYISTYLTPEFSNESKKEKYIKFNNSLYSNKNLMDRYDATKTWYLDELIYDLTTFNVQKGRALDSKDFQLNDNSIIPVLIGHKYSQLFSIGDRFKVSWYSDEIEHEIVGILSPNSKWLSSQDYLNQSIQSLDESFVAPFFPKQRDGSPSDVAVRIQSSFIKLKSGTDSEEAFESIKHTAHNLGLATPVLRTVAEDLERYHQKNKSLTNFNLFLGLFFLFITLIGVITITQSSIQHRMYEIGVRRITGATIADIIMIIVGEVMIIILFSSALGVYFRYLSFVNSPLIEIMPILDMFNGSLYASLVIIILILIGISALLPIYKIKKMSPSELIGGKD